MSCEITGPAFTSLSEPRDEMKASKSLRSGETVPDMLWQRDKPRPLSGFP